jgi:hypothetical protein
LISSDLWTNVPFVSISRFLIALSSAILDIKGASPSTCLRPLWVLPVSVSPDCIQTWNAECAIVILANLTTLVGIPNCSIILYNLSPLTYFHKMKVGLWNHHPVCLCVCPPLITFEVISGFSWNLVGRCCHWRWPWCSNL